jgi:glucose-1-phosphate thymidylyltransferase
VSRPAEYSREVVGVVPAAGWGNRLGPLPFSKEMYPVGFSRTQDSPNIRPKFVCQYLLERLRLAGITKTFVVLRNGKWDIPSFFQDGHALGMNLAYLIMRIPFGVPYTVDQAYCFVKEAVVALGFPDIIFQPSDAFSKLLIKQQNTRADIVLGLSSVDEPQKWDMVDLTTDGKIRRFYIKHPRTDLHYAWFIAVWTPVFSDFMHQYLIDRQAQTQRQDNSGNLQMLPLELYMGDVFQAAIDADLSIEYVIFPEGNCIDIGTPENLVRVAKSKDFDELI